jgi:alkanesulfonate monooxygenase SsuD/methylene tetrahydromethanopterin reductase-like flavin-dependent oxidoreductase (luciferase family)
MKFSLFVHMERWDESVSHRQLFEDLTELTLMAEAGGFSTVWIGEHHAMEYTISPSPMPLLAYLAAKTTTIHLGAGTIIAPFWHPLRVAGECALLDVISNGRMEVGLARGAYQVEFDRMAGGMPASSGGQALREMVPVVRTLWQGDYAHDGDIWKFPTSTSVPKPIQKPNPPMWIAARDPDSHNFAVANGCNVMVTPLMKGDEEVLDLKNKFQTALDNNPGRATPTTDGAAPYPRAYLRRSGRLASRRQSDFAVLSHLRCVVRQQANPSEWLPRTKPGREVCRASGV